MSMSVDEKRERFVRLAEARTANALRSIRVIGNLSNRSHYDFTEADVKKIIAILTKELDLVSRRFSDKMRSKAEFRL